MKTTDYYTHDRREILTLINFPISNVLDIGCGKGGVATELKLMYHGIEITGVDRFQDIDFNYSSKFEKFVACDLSKDWPTINYSDYDLVLLLDILEHLENPLLVLERLRNSLKAGTKIIISLPNFLNYSSLWQIIKTRKFEYQDSGILDRTHLRFFTKTDAEIMFANANLKIIKYHAHELTKNWKIRLIRKFAGYDFTAYQNIFVCEV